MFAPCRWRSPDRHRAGAGAPALQRPGAARRARACPSPAFNCLKQDGQDCQDLQDEQDEAARTRRKGLEDLNGYRTSAQHGEKVREVLNRSRRAAAL